MTSKMTAQHRSWLAQRLAMAGLLCVAAASGGCRSYMVALERDLGKYEVLEAICGHCNDNCPHTSCRSCQQCSDDTMVYFAEEPAFIPTGGRPVDEASEAVPFVPPPCPLIRSAANGDELPVSVLLPVPVRPVFSPRHSPYEVYE